MQPKDEYSDPPPRGSVFKGPAGWFTLDIPGGLQIDQDEAFIEVKTARETVTGSAEWSMTLYSAWVEDNEDNHNAAFDPSTLFPFVTQIAKEPPLNVAGRAQSWSGTSVERVKGPWWNGLFRRRPVYHWRLWIVEYETIIVVASLQAKARLPLKSDVIKQCESVLNSLTFNEQLAKPPELFRREVLQLAQKYFPLLESKAKGSFNITVAESDINLANLYRSYLLDPGSIKNIVLPGITAMVRIQEWSPEQLMPPLEDVQDRIMPMLYPKEDPSAELKDFVRMPWVGSLDVRFVLDEQDTYRFVHEEMLNRWHIDLDQLTQIALKNLEDFAERTPLEVTLVGGDDDAKILMPVNPGVYNSVRLLGNHLHQRLREYLGPELVVGIPNRDFFVAVSMNDRTLIQQVQERVTHDFQSMHHPLTRRLLVISADGVSEYCDD